MSRLEALPNLLGLIPIDLANATLASNNEEVRLWSGIPGASLRKQIAQGKVRRVRRRISNATDYFDDYTALRDPEWLELIVVTHIPVLVDCTEQSSGMPRAVMPVSEDESGLAKASSQQGRRSRLPWCAKEPPRKALPRDLALHLARS